MTDRILEQLIKLQIIESEEMEVYRFGLEALFLKGVHYVSYLLIALLCCEVPKFIIFFVAFLLLRKNAGGYHAKTKAGCYVVSCLSVVCVTILLKYMVLQGILLWCVMLLFVIADGVILCLAPLDNKNRELDEIEKRYFRKKSIFILTLENILIVLFQVIYKSDYTTPIILAVICSAFLLILSQIGNETTI